MSNIDIKINKVFSKDVRKSDDKKSRNNISSIDF